MTASFFSDFPVSPEDAQTIQQVIDSLAALEERVTASETAVDEDRAAVEQLKLDVEALLATIPSAGTSVWKAPVRMATAAAVDVASSPSTFDGVSALPGDRILLIDQPNPADNGIWSYDGASLPLVRPVDADTPDKRGPGIFVFTLEGTTNATTLFRARGATDALIFEAFSGAGGAAPTGPRFFDIASFLQGALPLQATVFSYSPSRALTIPVGFAGSSGAAVSPPSGLIGFDLNLDGTKVADLLLESSGSTFFDPVDDVNTLPVPAGSVLTLVSPDNLRGASDISFTIASTLD